MARQIKTKSGECNYCCPCDAWAILYIYATTNQTNYTLRNKAARKGAKIEPCILPIIFAVWNGIANGTHVSKHLVRPDMNFSQSFRVLIPTFMPNNWYTIKMLIFEPSSTWKNVFQFDHGLKNQTSGKFHFVNFSTAAGNCRREDISYNYTEWLYWHMEI